MKVKLRVDSLFLISYIIIMMLGNFASSTIISLLHHGFAVLAVMVLVLKKYKPSKVLWLVAGYIVYLLLTTFFVNNCSISIYVVINHIKILLFLAVVDQQIQRAPRRTVKLLYRGIFVLCAVNLLCMIVMPRGVLQTDVVINEWTTVQRAVWLLGNVNSMISWYLLLLLFLLWDHIYKPKSKVVLVSTVLLAVSAIVLSRSSTSIVVMLIAVCAIGMGCFGRQRRVGEINIKVLYWIYLGLFIFVMAGQMSVFNPILSAVFGKDSTFSMRTDIWVSLMGMIAQKPLFGWGFLNGVQAVDILGNVAFTSAHNQILQVVWHGGIVGLSLLVLVFAVVSNRIAGIQNTRLKSALALLLFAMLIELLFEVALERFETWTFVICCCLLAEHMKEKVRL